MVYPDKGRASESPFDVHKNPVAVVLGHGKPSSARVRKAMGSRMLPGSLPIHDLKKAHNALVRDGGLESEAYWPT